MLLCGALSWFNDNCDIVNVGLLFVMSDFIVWCAIIAMKIDNYTMRC